MDLSAHQNITKIHALKMIFKIINRYLHIHISCVYIYRFHKRIPMDFGPSSKQAFGTSQSKTWIVDCSQLLETHFNFTVRCVRKPTQLWCIVHLNEQKVNTPFLKSEGGVVHHIDSDRESRSPKKSETAKIIQFHTDLRCLMFHSKAWDQEKISGKNFK